MRIRHLVLTNSFAGAEQHVCVLANEQARHGHEVEVWGGEVSAMRKRLSEQVHHLNRPSIGSAVRLRESGQVDVVHAHMTRAEVAVSLTALNRPHPALVTTRHFAAVRGRSLAGHVARPVLRRTFATQIAVSEFVASRVDGQTTVVYAGVEAQPEVTTDREPVILVAQRLSPEKRTVEALEAFAASGLAGHGWRMEFAGRGEQHDELVSKISALGLGANVSLLGFTDSLHLHFRTSAVVLATAPAEPFGLTVVEAMAHGTPVVATARGGHLESVGRAAGAQLYEPGDVDRAGALLRNLAKNSVWRHEYGQTLRAIQREWFTTRRQYEDTQRVYEGVVHP